MATNRPKNIEVGQIRAGAMNRSRERDGITEWYWRARRKGERDMLWSGWATRDAAQEILARMVTKGLPSPQEVREARPLKIRTLGDLLEEWTDRQKARPDLSPHTAAHYEYASRHLVAWLREVDCERVDRATIEQYRNNRMRENASPRVLLQEIVEVMLRRYRQDTEAARRQAVSEANLAQFPGQVIPLPNSGTTRGNSSRGRRP